MTGRSVEERNAKWVDLGNKLHQSVYTASLPGGGVFVFLCVLWMSTMLTEDYWCGTKASDWIWVLFWIGLSNPFQHVWAVWVVFFLAKKQNYTYFFPLIWLWTSVWQLLIWNKTIFLSHHSGNTLFFLFVPNAPEVKLVLILQVKNASIWLSFTFIWWVNNPQTKYRMDNANKTHTQSMGDGTVSFLKYYILLIDWHFRCLRVNHV